MKRLNLDILSPGDIILAGYEGDKQSELIRKYTNSQYSHAMLVWRDSILEAGELVVATNPQRILFNDADNVCVMHLKPEFYHKDSIARAIAYARNKVGTLYGSREAYAAIDEKIKGGDMNRQFCSRLVAQAYEYGGINLVADSAFCSPEDIHKSNKLIQIEDCTIEASQDYIDFATSPSAIDDQNDALKELLYNAREITSADIVTIEQLDDFISCNNEFDVAISKALQESGYLDIWKIEMQYNPELYDGQLFFETYFENLTQNALHVFQSTEMQIREYKQMLTHYVDKNNKDACQYFSLMIELYKNLLDMCEKRKDATAWAYMNILTLP